MSWCWWGASSGLRFWRPDGNSVSPPRIDDALDFAEESRVLLILHEPSGVPADVVFGALSLEDEIVRGARRVDIAGVPVALPAPEAIVVMKAIARRARDIADIEGILEAHEQLDLDWVRARLTEFDQALGDTELLAEFNRILTRSGRTTVSDDTVE